MPISRGLVISLGTSVLGCTLLFLYFRNRMSVIERKVDVMFDLIQNHNQQQQQQPVGYEEDQDIQFSVREKSPTEDREKEQDNDNRIAVSDNEDYDNDAFDSDDSDEVSDNEDDVSPLKLKESENIEISDIKTISLGGPENIQDTVEVDSLDDIDDDEDDDDEDNEDDDDDDENVISTNNKEEEKEKEEDLTVKEIDYSGLKVSELKSIAKERGLSGYKSLKKSALVNLLKTIE